MKNLQQEASGPDSIKSSKAKSNKKLKGSEPSRILGDRINFLKSINSVERHTRLRAYGPEALEISP